MIFRKKIIKLKKYKKISYYKEKVQESLNKFRILFLIQFKEMIINLQIKHNSKMNK